MAGIGFALRRLVDRDDLLGIVQGYAVSAVISSGPWIFTVLALAGVSFVATNGDDAIRLFEVILFYNFAFSLVITGPIVLIATRFLADNLYSRDMSGVPGMLLGLLVVTLGASLLFAAPFYVWFVELSPQETFFAIINLVVVSALWSTSIFLTATKNYSAYVTVFLVGMVVAFVMSGWLGSVFNLSGLLGGFTIGLAVIVFAVIARVQVDYSYLPDRPFEFLAGFKKYRSLAFLGLVSSAAIWIDKWVMWSAPDREVIAGHLAYHPSYDPAIFFAFLTTIPAMALFTLSLETGFFEKYTAYFSSISRHANLKQIRQKHREMVQQWLANTRNIIVLQATVAALAIYMSPSVIEMTHGSYEQLGIFRLGVLGAFFHVLLLLQSTLLAYLDLRWFNLGLQTLFLTLNGGLTWYFMNQGFEFYGYGYFLACLISFVVGFALTLYALHRLPYLTFIGNNPSVCNGQVFLDSS